MRGVFVTATDTGVGKTVLSAAVLATMVAQGERVRAYKPVVTGLDDPREAAACGAWPPDHELLASVAAMRPEQVAPYRFGPAVSPHLAARLASAPIDAATLLAHAHALAGDDDGLPVDPHVSGEAAAGGGSSVSDDASTRDGRATLVVEGVGGLLVPLAEGYCVRDLAVDLGLAVVIAARPGLGTINHTLLTLAAARSARLDVRAVVLTPWPARPSPVERSNRDTIARLGDVDVHGLAPVAGPDAGELARAGASLPWRAWVGERPRS
jgi:dethiobiotin synthetase